MYKVIKGFTSEQISASKGKVIDIKDKKVANNLISAGVIEPISNKEISSAEKDKEIASLQAEVIRLEQENSVLVAQNEELQESLNEALADTPEEEQVNEENLENNDLEQTDEDSNDEDEKENGEIVADPEKDKKE